MRKTYAPMHSIRDDNNELLYGFIIRNTFRQQVITVGTSAIKLPTTPLDKRLLILIVNNSTSGQILYLGDSTVTTSNGIPLYPRQSIIFNIEDDVDIYGISSAASADIRLLEGT